MASNKSSDNIGLTAEMFKFAPIEATDILLSLLNNILVHGQLPDNRRSIQFIMIAKHMNAKTVDEFRPIALLNICYKVYARLLKSRVRNCLDKTKPPSQAGFRKGYSVDDHLLAITLLLERVHEFNLKLWAISLDLDKAFDIMN